MGYPAGALRILHVTPTYIPAYRYGGPILSVHGLCRALVARGHDEDQVAGPELIVGSRYEKPFVPLNADDDGCKVGKQFG